MKKIILSFFLLVSYLSLSNAQDKTSIQLKNNEFSFKVEEKSSTSFTIKASLASLSITPTTTKAGSFVNLESEGLIKIFDAGLPNIPVISKLIEIPQDATVSYNIINFDEEIIDLADYDITSKICPAQPTVFKNVDAITLDFIYNQSVYQTNEYINTEIVTIEEIGMMRATRLGRVEINPIQYNPVKNQLRILNNIQIEIVFENANIQKTNELKTKYYSTYFNNANSEIINYDVNSSKELITDVPVNYVIVSLPEFHDALQPFIEWKKLKGFNVIEAYTNNPSVGTTTTSIKSYLQTMYNSANPQTFVLIVGDHQQIPAWAGTTGGHVTDLYYMDYTNDNIPDVYSGRFSATTVAELTPQITKTLEYEKYEMPDPSYLSRVVMVAGDDSNFEITHGNGQINYGTNYYFNGDNDITSHTYLQPLDNNAASIQIRQNISDGVGFGNYTAHCSPSGWGTPSFTISNIASLTNAHKYGLLIGNCCQSNQFQDNSFGENLLRAVDKGAIGYIGGTNSSTWDEDFWWAVGFQNAVENPPYDANLGAYDGLFHNRANELVTSDWYITQGQMNICGNLAVEASTSGTKKYYWEIYMLMGDPSVMNYLGVPEAINYELTPNVMLIGSSSIQISTNPVVPFAYIAVNQGGERLALVMTDEFGVANIEFSNALSNETVTLVMTAQNKQPVIEEITPITSNAPYVLLDSYTPENATYNSETQIDATLENVAAFGSGYDANSVTATLSLAIPDQYIIINDAVADFGNIIAGTTSNLTDAFSVTISDDVPDQHQFNLIISMTSSDNITWQSNMKIIANAPELSAELEEINDNNADFAIVSNPATYVMINEQYEYRLSILSNSGNSNNQLDAGETALIRLNTGNIGHADIQNATCYLSSNSQYITINTNNIYINDISIGDEFPNDFSITVAEGTPIGTVVNLDFTFVYAGYEEVKSISVPVGVQIENFETGDFTTYPWTLTGTPNWSVVNTGAQQGTYCAKSGAITHDGSTSFSISVNVLSDLNIKFWVKTSSESTYDFLKFYDGNTVLGSWSGTTDWTEVSFPITSGSHTFKWEYMKDASVTNGSDCAWVDNITFPAMSVSTKSTESVTFSAPNLPSWLTLTDNGDGTAKLDGTAPGSVGEYDVRITASNGMFEANQEFNLKVGLTANIESVSEFKIYPNPTNGMLNIYIPEYSSANITIIDLTGKMLLNKDINSENTAFDLSEYSKGIYLVKLVIDNKVNNSKILIK